MATMTMHASSPTTDQLSWTARERHLTIGGLLAIGLSFGLARYGYGLFLPDIRREFDLSVSTVGVIGSAAYVGYLLALLAVGRLADRAGPRVLVGTGGASAVLGISLVAVAPNVAVLTVGLVLAGTSPAWSWAPYSDAVEVAVSPAKRERVLSIVPAGTAVGTAAVGPLALVASGDAWRWAWGAMAVMAAVAAVYATWTLPAHGPRRRDSPRSHSAPGISWLVLPAAFPLYLTALAYGVIGSFYWNYATEVISATTTSAVAVPAFWTLMGGAGLLGMLAGVVLSRLGLGRSSALLFSTLGLALALLGVLPGSIVAAGISATLYGPAFMVGASLLAVWSYQVFPGRPTAGFTATLLCLGAGTILGPATLGLLADHVGLRTAFLLTACLCLVTIAARPRRHP
ncbi:MFS transporter [Aeromicrobium sp. CTD01-1L150]|uniref:MFS transporter n=1 Tax=Aeromicrobium sp. CTD01-1L150 TaxID=3341830 RepID=UPI0035BF5FAE